MMKRFARKILGKKSLFFFQKTMIEEGIISRKDTVLDIGCGIGNTTLNLPYKKIVGIDACADYRKKYLKTHPKSEFICGILPDVLSEIPSHSFTKIILFDVIEHLTKKDGYKLLKEIHRIVTFDGCIVLITPVEFTDNKELVEDETKWSYGNVYNYHRSHWLLEEFTDLGYSKLVSSFIPSFYADNYIIVIKKEFKDEIKVE